MDANDCQKKREQDQIARWFRSESREEYIQKCMDKLLKYLMEKEMRRG